MLKLTLPLLSYVPSLLLKINDQLKNLILLSMLITTTNPDLMECSAPDVMIKLHPIPLLPKPPSSDTNPCVMYLTLDAKLNNTVLSLFKELADNDDLDNRSSTLYNNLRGYLYLLSKITHRRSLNILHR